MPSQGLIKNCLFQNIAPALHVSQSESWQLVNNNFVITTPMDLGNASSSFVLVNGTALTVDSCRFEGNGVVGTAIQVQENSTVTDLHVVYSEFRHMKSAGIFIHTKNITATIDSCVFEENGAGVIYSAQAPTSTSHLNLIRSYFTNTTQTVGVAAEIAGAAYIASCYFTDNRQGLATHTSERVQIMFCTFSGHTNSAMWLTPSGSQNSTVEVDNLEFYNCQSWAIDCGSGVTLFAECPYCSPWGNDNIMFDSGDVTTNINLDTCQLSPALESPSGELHVALIALGVLGGFVLCVGVGGIVLFVILRRKPRHEEFEYSMSELEEFD